MTDKGKTAKLIHFRPKPDQLLRLIRKLAAAGKIGYLNHSDKVRMPSRDFDVFDVEDVLRNGMLSGPIDPGANAGEWKVKVVGCLDRTSRRMGVVVIVVRDVRLLIKTTEWEDIR